MSEPRTAAGLELAKHIPPFTGHLAAIEAEAVAAYKAELAEKVRALTTTGLMGDNPLLWWLACRDDVIALIEGSNRPVRLHSRLHSSPTDLDNGPGNG